MSVGLVDEQTQTKDERTQMSVTNVSLTSVKEYDPSGLRAPVSLSLVILSLAPTRHRLTRRAIPDLVFDDTRTDMLIIYR